MSDPTNTGVGPTSPPVTNPDGSITYEGYTIPPGSAQHDDLSRLENGDPKAPYLIVARYRGEDGIGQQWPTFAAVSGLGGVS